MTIKYDPDNEMMKGWNELAEDTVLVDEEYFEITNYRII